MLITAHHALYVMRSDEESGAASCYDVALDFDESTARIQPDGRDTERPVLRVIRIRIMGLLVVTITNHLCPNDWFDNFEQVVCEVKVYDFLFILRRCHGQLP